MLARETTAASFSIATSLSAFLKDGTMLVSCNLKHRQHKKSQTQLQHQHGDNNASNLYTASPSVKEETLYRQKLCISYMHHKHA
uniref:Uncharacterized protein n=1 Tax=Rhizophora mucronata TaxID=61149 RepID=A0A2P2KRM1_RHIMU